MITYKYSLIKDIQRAFDIVFKNRIFLIENNLIVFWPNPIRWVWLVFNMPKGPKIQTTSDITCYWLSCGTWGTYYENENAIGICPWKIEKEGLKEVIVHEIVHLEHPEAEEMDHEKKEEYIEKIIQDK